MERVMNLQRNINKEIRGYEEEVFMGLSLRQLLCSIVAIGVAVGVYYGFRDYLGQETVSWVCIVAAVPVAAAGFFTYDGLTFEKFLLAVFAAPRAVPVCGCGNRKMNSTSRR
jgi:hypothetical protein